MSPTVVLATNNAKKLVELRRLVAEAAADVTVLGLGDLPSYPEPAETERTFVGNALLKARACVAATGLPALADDSGLVVDVLNGMPGVRSARWSGPDATDASNNVLLLAQLDDVPDEERTAHFEASVALVLPGGRERTTTGRADGRLLRAPVGENGFGYDPLFVADGQHDSFGVLDAAQKDRVSHRGQAVRAMLPVLLSELTKEDRR
ncbi:MAG TPA: non-canonical purine NTP pyrophosphatase [Friedmanniella sp.]